MENPFLRALTIGVADGQDTGYAKTCPKPRMKMKGHQVPKNFSVYLLGTS
jgi:hypothetical protein